MIQTDYLAQAAQAERLADELKPGVDQDQLRDYARKLRRRAALEPRSFAPARRGWDPAAGD